MTTQPTPDQDLPFHLRGNFAPVSEEVTATDLEVTGAVPPELQGRFIRNGANPVTGTSPHWFLGNGMLHGVELGGGRARWYRNRYVKTPLLDEPDAQRIGADGKVDHRLSLANTHVISHAGRILALEEGSFPYEVTPELDTVGCVDFDGKLKTAMTAHPRICPETGELLFFGYAQFPPYLTYHRVSASGELVQSEAIDVPGPTMMHDWNVTRNHVIFMDLPVVFDLKLALEGAMPFRWSDDYGARLGVMPRDGSSADVQWYEVEPCYVFHPMNAYEDGDQIVLDVARFPSMWRQGGQFDESARLHRWTLDRAAGVVREQPLDDRTGEFPRVADDRIGLPHRFGYMAGTAANGAVDGLGGSLLKYDLQTGQRWAHEWGGGRSGGEGVFASAGPQAAEDEGWLLTYVYDPARDRSDLVILDATNVEAPPVAAVHLPVRVPAGFHGSWIADPA